MSTVLLEDILIAPGVLPTAPSCIRCHNPINELTASYGRIVGRMVAAEANTVRAFRAPDGAVHTQAEVASRFFPEKITGWACPTCYEEAYSTKWYDKQGHLRRAFENLSIPLTEKDRVTGKQVARTIPSGVVGEASVTKGLYAPHAGSGKTAVIHPSRLPREDKPQRKLTGFERVKRTDIKTALTNRTTGVRLPTDRRVIAKGGKWKGITPAEFAEANPFASVANPTGAILGHYQTPSSAPSPVEQRPELPSPATTVVISTDTLRNERLTNWQELVATLAPAITGPFTKIKCPSCLGIGGCKACGGRDHIWSVPDIYRSVVRAIGTAAELGLQEDPDRAERIRLRPKGRF